MTGTTTGQTSLATATDSDDMEAFMTGPLTTDLQAVANLFESATGHDHTGAGKGKPVGSAGIASGVALTNPVVGGAGGTPAGTLGFSGTNLQVGDGTANRAVNVGPWATYTPIVTQPGALTITVNTARYDVSGKRVAVFLLVTIGQVGTTANDIVVTSPVAPLNVGAASCVGSFQYRGATFRAGSVIAAASNTFKLQVDNNVGFLGTAPALALAVGDTISLTATYEAA